MKRRLPRGFYDRPTLEVARDLIGKVLVHHTPDGVASGVIVEAEAYIGEDDPACHAAAGLTKRSSVLYGRPGMAYVYFNYGMHCLVNAVTEAEGAPAAVLLRALDPLKGVELMRRRRMALSRNGHEIARHSLCRGPGNLTRALGITLEQNNTDLCGADLLVEDHGFLLEPIAWTPRVGISVGTDKPWRCVVAGHMAVSKANVTRAHDSLRPPGPPRRTHGRRDRSRQV
ncbi:MAG: DNA-3-methyladenine glycosylase [Luteitalea sp.]|nr:DNA-3-methyladenine glycosylase [Luteitalea sp.]